MRVCDHNIDQSGRNRRMLAGLCLFALGLGVAVVVVKAELPLAYRSAVFVPFMAASLMVFQSTHRTCVLRAARSERETIQGVQRIANPEQLAADRRRARAVYRLSALVSLVATAVLLLIP